MADIKNINRSKRKADNKPIAVTRYRNDTPLRILKECINYPIEVKTAKTSGGKTSKSKMYQGILKEASDNMNVVLDEGNIIQGNKIKYIVLPDIMRFNPLLKGRDELVYKNNETKQKFKNKTENKRPDATKKKESRKQKEADVKDLVKELEQRESSKNTDKNKKRKLEQEKGSIVADKNNIKKAKTK